MMAYVGDRVLVEGECNPLAPRAGTVRAVRGSLVTVQWDHGEQSTFAPLAATMWAPEQWQDWRSTTGL